MSQTVMDQQTRIVNLEAEIRRTRHDIRSALVPLMLAIDTLCQHADPNVRDSAASVARSVERVLASLNATGEFVALG